MAATVLIVLYFLSSSIVSVRSGPALHILKNQSATASPHQFPWLVSLQRPDLVEHGKWNHHCGGSLIAVRDGQTESDIVVSAAHCFRECYSYCIENGTFIQKLLCMTKIFEMRDSVGRERMVLGAHALNEDDAAERIFSSVASLRCHEFDIFKNDIVVVKMSSPVKFTAKIRPILLPARDYADAPGCQSAGWGYMGYKELPNELRYANVTIFDDDKCSKSWQQTYGYDPDLMLCAGVASIGERGGDLHQVACGGDSGSSLSCPDETGASTLVGVASRSQNPLCESRGSIHPDSYTKVASYADWIVKGADELTDVESK